MPLARPIRVAVLTSVHPPFDTRIFHRQAVSSVEAGLEVTLVAPGAPRAIVDGVRLVPLWGGGGRAGRVLRWPLLFVRALRLRPDVYHLHDPELLPWGLLLRAVSRRPVIYDSHEFLAESILSKHWIPAPFRRPLARLSDRMEKAIARRLDAVVVVTDEMADRFAPVQPRTVVVMNLPRVAGAPSDGAPPERRPDAVYVGLMNRERGLTILRDTAACIRRVRPDFELHVLGPVEWHGLETERASFDGGGWDASGVVFDPPVPQTEVASHLARASVGWLPMNPRIASKTLAWPVKLGEYMAAGLPVVASDLPVQARVIRETGCGVVVEEFLPEAHAEAIVALLDDPDRARELGENGRCAVAERYGWENQSERLLALYRELRFARGRN